MTGAVTALSEVMAAPVTSTGAAVEDSATASGSVAAGAVSSVAGAAVARGSAFSAYMSANFRPKA